MKTTRNPFAIGPHVVQWALHQVQDDGTEFDPPRPGAHNDIGVNGCSIVTDYLCANESLPLDAKGFEMAYVATRDAGALAPPAAHPSPPMELTPDITAKLATLETLTRKADRVAFLKWPGNDDIFNYMATNGLITPSQFTADYHATRMGQYDDETGEELSSPRAWE
jgi:hypothetical protein